jgi:hypothetical protein
MRECQQCGESNQESARFCVVCGAPLPEGAAAAFSPAAADEGGDAPLAMGQDGSTRRPLAAEGAGDGSGPIALGDDIPLDGPRTLVGFLVSYDAVALGQYWPVHQGKNVVGRQGAATGLDVEIAHATTSSVHAVLLAAAKPGRVVVEDTGSTNGTFVNDNVLAVGQRWELRDGDRLRFGLFDTTVKIIQS